MVTRRLMMVALATLLTLSTATAHADSAGTTPPPPEDTGDEEDDNDEEDEEEDEKGCAHVAGPQNLAVFGAGILLFVVASRRGRQTD